MRRRNISTARRPSTGRTISIGIAWWRTAPTRHPPPVPSLNWVLIAGREPSDARPARRAALMINNVYGMLRAAERGLGVASLPDYLCSTSRRLVRVLPQLEGPTFDAYFVYPEEMRASKRVRVFRDFLLRKIPEQPVW